MVYVRRSIRNQCPTWLPLSPFSPLVHGQTPPGPDPPPGGPGGPLWVAGRGGRLREIGVGGQG